jgi:hypothetical protein
MLRMSGRGQSRLGYAEKAERRAQFALGYLVILCVMLILIAGILISVGWSGQRAQEGSPPGEQVRLTSAAKKSEGQTPKKRCGTYIRCMSIERMRKQLGCWPGELYWAVRALPRPNAAGRAELDSRDKARRLPAHGPSRSCWNPVDDPQGQWGPGEWRPLG